MVYQITISGLDGTEPSRKPRMKRENGRPNVGFWHSTPNLGEAGLNQRATKIFARM